MRRTALHRLHKKFEGELLHSDYANKYAKGPLPAPTLEQRLDDFLRSRASHSMQNQTREEDPMRPKHKWVTDASATKFGTRTNVIASVQPAVENPDNPDGGEVRIMPELLRRAIATGDPVTEWYRDNDGIAEECAEAHDGVGAESGDQAGDPTPLSAAARTHRVAMQDDPNKKGDNGNPDIRITLSELIEGWPNPKRYDGVERATSNRDVLLAAVLKTASDETPYESSDGLRHMLGDPAAMEVLTRIIEEAVRPLLEIRVSTLDKSRRRSAK